MSLEPVDPLVFQAMQREIRKLRHELGVQRALVERLTQLPSILPPTPLHKLGKIGNVIRDTKTIRSE